MRVLGVDPGSRVCGYAIVDIDDRGECHYVECGVIHANEEQSGDRGLILAWVCLVHQ